MDQIDTSLNVDRSDQRIYVSHQQTYLENQREVLRYITDIGSSLRLHMDTDTLVKRVTEASCKALGFRHSVLYLSDGKGHFRAGATSGISAEEEEYLHQHPLPDTVVAQLINQEHRISESYFIPAESPLWQNENIASFFVIVDENSASAATPSHADRPTHAPASWQPEDLMVVPLVSGDNLLLGFLTPDAPLDGRRPTVETLALLELFANQAAVVIEGARLYEDARQSSEERAALIEIGRALSAPEALYDLQAVYQAIYEQVRRVMPADAFFVTRYYREADKLIMDYLIDEGILYPLAEYTFIPTMMKKLLLRDATGYLFATEEEYATFTAQDPAPPDDDDLIGNMRPSQSLIFAPIYYGEEILGMLSAQSYQPHAYTQRYLEMLKEIGVQAGIAITNARLNTELREALTQAQESERLKNHFLMTASHELRTPLTAVQGYLELIGHFGSVLDEDSKLRFLSNARRACEELVLLLGNVMDTSHIDQDRVSLNLGPVQLVKAVELILEILEPTIALEERPVEVKIPEDLYVEVDDLRLRQVLLNIVGNALKYTPAPGGIAITAELVDGIDLNRRLASASSPLPTQQPVFNTTCRQFALIAIRDWGPGISLEDQARLFTKFMRLDSAINSIQRGAGLGLYLCRQLIEAMGGCIWLESKGISGEGSTFILVLPLYNV